MYKSSIALFDELGSDYRLEDNQKIVYYFDKDSVTFNKRNKLVRVSFKNIKFEISKEFMDKLKIAIDTQIKELI